MTNEYLLLDTANQRTLADEHCNICKHKESRRARCGHIVETCHHPNLESDGDSDWPEVDGTMICDWFESCYKTAGAEGGE